MNPGYEKMISDAAEAFRQIEARLGRQLDESESGYLDWLLDKLQHFLDACAGDPMLDGAASDLRQRIRKRIDR